MLVYRIVAVNSGTSYVFIFSIAATRRPMRKVQHHSSEADNIPLIDDT